MGSRKGLCSQGLVASPTLDLEVSRLLLRRNGTLMNNRTRTFLRSAMVALAAITAYCTVMAQDRVKETSIDPHPPTPSPFIKGEGEIRLSKGIPISKGSLSKPGSDPNNAGAAASGWLLFDKCLVFAVESVELPSQETGVLAKLEVRENDSVNADQVIASLDGKAAELEREAAGLQAQLAASEAKDESEIRLAEAFVEETKLQVDIYEEMANKGTASTAEFRQRQLAADQAKVRLIRSKAAKEERVVKSKLAQSAFTLSQLKVNRFSLRSPIAGTVTRVDHRAGEWVQAGTTIVKIIRLDEVRIDCFVSMDQIDPSGLIGKTVQVISKRGTTESLFSGRIASYDPDVTSTGQVRVHATIQNQKTSNHWLLLPGMFVTMQLQKPQ